MRQWLNRTLESKQQLRCEHWTTGAFSKMLHNHRFFPPSSIYLWFYLFISSWSVDPWPEGEREEEAGTGGSSKEIHLEETLRRRRRSKTWIIQTSGVHFVLFPPKDNVSCFVHFFLLEQQPLGVCFRRQPCFQNAGQMQQGALFFFGHQMGVCVKE